MGCKRQRGPRRVSTFVWHAAPNSNSRGLALGVLEISIAAGTGADVMPGGAVILSYPSHSIPVYVYIN